jgi:hypothetical protein
MAPVSISKVKNEEITVNYAHVIKADVKGSLGMVDMIHKVLIPPPE